MADFTITHRAGLPAEKAASEELAGAVFCSPEHDGRRDGPDYYELITLDDLDRHLEIGSEITYGSELELIEQQLLPRHPSPAGSTKLLFVKAYETPRQATLVDSYRARWRRGERGPNDPSPDVWLVLSHPLVERSDAETLREQIAACGPVLIKDANPDIESWREKGFTAAARHPDLLLLNFNPSRVRDTFFKRKVADYEGQMRGYFPHDPLRAIWQVVSSLPGSMPYDNVVSLNTGGRVYGEEYRDNGRYGRGRTRDDRCDCIKRCADWCGDILQGLAAIKRLKPDTPPGWYRDRVVSNSRYSSASGQFNSAVKTLLPCLHGVETLMNQPGVVRNASPLWVNDEVAEKLLKFCRFLRKEARALGLKIPPAPKPPQKPTAKASGSKRRAGSKGNGAKARRSRKTSVEPASRADRTPSDESASAS